MNNSEEVFEGINLEAHHINLSLLYMKVKPTTSNIANIYSEMSATHAKVLLVDLTTIYL